MSEDGPKHGEKFEAGRTPEEVTARTGDKHERHDVRTRPLITFMVAVLIALGIVNVVIGGFGWLLYKHSQASAPPPSSISRMERVIPEDVPHLQSSPRFDMEQMLKEETALIDSYGVTDAKAGLYRIPVQRAMELIAQRGLPPRRHDIPTTAGAYAVMMNKITTATTGRIIPEKR